MFCVSRQPTTKKLHWQCSEGNGYFVIATTNKYDSFYGDEISENNCDKKQETEQVVLALKKKDHIFTEDLSCFYLSTPSGWEGAACFGCAALVAADRSCGLLVIRRLRPSSWCGGWHGVRALCATRRKACRHAGQQL